MLIKIIGSALIIIPCSLFGVIIKNAYQQRIFFLKDIISDLPVIENEIRYSVNDLKVIFTKLKEKPENNSSELFRGFSGYISDSNGEPLTTTWSEFLKDGFSKKILVKNDIKVFEKFGLVLGSGDIDTQLKNLEYFKKNLEFQINDAENRYQKRGMMFSKLGIYAGILIVIIFI